MSLNARPFRRYLGAGLVAYAIAILIWFAIQDSAMLDWVLAIAALGLCQAVAAFAISRGAPVRGVIIYSALATVAGLVAVLGAVLVLVLAIPLLLEAEVQIMGMPKYLGAIVFYAMVVLFFIPALWIAWRSAAPSVGPKC